MFAGKNANLVLFEKIDIRCIFRITNFVPNFRGVSNMDFGSQTGFLRTHAKTISLVVIPLFLAYLACINHVPEDHIGVAYNRNSAQVHIQGPGMYFTAPWVFVNSVSTEPKVVCFEIGTVTVQCRKVKVQKDLVVDFVGRYKLSDLDDASAVREHVFVHASPVFRVLKKDPLELPPGLTVPKGE